MPSAIGAELRQVVPAPRAENERILADPLQELRENRPEPIGRVHVPLPDGSQLAAELTQLSFDYRADEPVELAGRRLVGARQLNGPDLDRLHAAEVADVLPAGGLQVYDDVPHPLSS